MHVCSMIQQFHFQVFTQKKEDLGPQKDMYKNIHGHFIHGSLRKTTSNKLLMKTDGYTNC